MEADGHAKPFAAPAPAEPLVEPPQNASGPVVAAASSTRIPPELSPPVVLALQQTAGNVKVARALFGGDEGGTGDEIAAGRWMRSEGDAGVTRALSRTAEARRS